MCAIARATVPKVVNDRTPQQGAEMVGRAHKAFGAWRDVDARVRANVLVKDEGVDGAVRVHVVNNAMPGADQDAGPWAGDLAALPGRRGRPGAATRRADVGGDLSLAGAAGVVRGRMAAPHRGGKGEDGQRQGRQAERCGGWESHGLSPVRGNGRLPSGDVVGAEDSA